MENPTLVQDIHSIYKEHGVDLTLEEVQEMVKAADKEGDGMLTEQEFLDSGAQEVGSFSSLIFHSL